MNKEKQIEEMKSIIDKAEEEYSELWNEWFYDHKEGMKIDHEFLFFAKRLYEAGYRRASDVAREIFEEIEKIVLAGIEKDEHFREKMQTPTDRSYFEGGANSQRKIAYLIAELKKKYTKSEKDNG